MEKIISFKNFLNESLGVPDFVEKTTEFLYGLVMERSELFISGLQRKRKRQKSRSVIDLLDKEVEGYHRSYTIESEVIDGGIKSLRTDVNIDNFTLNIDISVIPDEDLDSEGFEASFDNNLSFERDSIVNPTLDLKLYLPMSVVKNPSEMNHILRRRGVLSSIKESLAHELTHLYEFYKSKNPLPTPQVINTMIHNIRKDKSLVGISYEWDLFLHCVYLSLSFEINARISELNERIKDKYDTSYHFDIHDFRECVYGSNTWDDMTRLRDFSAKDFFNDMTYDLKTDEDGDYILDQTTIDKNESQDEIKKKVLSFLIKKWDEKLRYVSQDFRSSAADFGEDIKIIKETPKKYMNDPMKFLQYFEKMFHQKWENFNRRVMRLIAKYDIDV